MPQSDPTLLSVSELSTVIQARRLSPVDLVEACLARIEKREPKLQAFVEVYAVDVDATFG
jgi:aspartyl-tRNA(Asn)/glutamyl-tRNA(Gln) amidotransferase subunit A